MKKNVFGFLALLVFVLSGCAGNDTSYKVCRLSGAVWGTTYNITYNGATVDDQSTISDAVGAAIARVGDAANAYDSTSEISRLNATGMLVGPSADMLYLLDRSRAVNILTGGTFDPTVGPVVDLWGFGAGSVEDADTVSDAEVERALALVGLDGVQSDNDRIILTRPGSRLDFAAIAKGYGVDCVARALSDKGVNDFMVEIGGEVRVSGKNPRGEAWRIQIDAPIPDTTGTHSRLAVIQVDEAALATSGNYRNFRLDPATGTVVGHTISPLTGRPVTTDILSATIVAADATTADALATAAMVLGVDGARKLIERLCADPSAGVYGALFVSSSADTDNPFKITTVNIPGKHASIMK